MQLAGWGASQSALVHRCQLQQVAVAARAQLALLLLLLLGRPARRPQAVNCHPGARAQAPTPPQSSPKPLQPATLF